VKGDARPGRDRGSKSGDPTGSADDTEEWHDEIDAGAQLGGVEQESGRGIQRNFEVGEPFNPWRKACSFYPPDVVARQRDLTDGQKRLYERAVRWAGKNGIFWRGFDTMADALGKSVRQVKDDMAVLESKGLIRHARCRRSSNVYSFLRHAVFKVRPTALQDSILKVQDSTLKVQDSVILKVQPTARESSPLESCPLNLGKADNKLIPDDASQKPRSAASPRVNAADRSPKSKKSQKADPRPPTSTPAEPNRAIEWSQRELAEVRRRIVAFWGREPEEGFEVSVMLRARGATAADVCDLLDRKHANTNCKQAPARAIPLPSRGVAATCEIPAQFGDRIALLNWHESA
jgi:hypothetical protein